MPVSSLSARPTFTSFWFHYHGTILLSYLTTPLVSVFLNQNSWSLFHKPCSWQSLFCLSSTYSLWTTGPSTPLEVWAIKPIQHSLFIIIFSFRNVFKEQAYEQGWFTYKLGEENSLPHWIMEGSISGPEVSGPMLLIIFFFLIQKEQIKKELSWDDHV